MSVSHCHQVTITNSHYKCVLSVDKLESFPTSFSPRLSIKITRKELRCEAYFPQPLTPIKIRIMLATLRYSNTQGSFVGQCDSFTFLAQHRLNMEGSTYTERQETQQIQSHMPETFIMIWTEYSYFWPLTAMLMSKAMKMTPR